MNAVWIFLLVALITINTMANEDNANASLKEFFLEPFD